MQNCPFCSGKLLRHIQSGSIYWFCRHCWQAMPVVILPERQAELARSQPSSNQNPPRAIVLSPV